jgi:SH3-like domain-containing protein
VKKLTLFVLVGTALLISGCGFGTTPAPTYTPLPTYTPQPTFTPPPTPTATFLPTATPIPIETATPAGAEGEAAAEAATTATPAGTQVTLAFGTNLRQGPGPEYEIVDVLNAGEPLLVLGRNSFGDWLFVQTATNQQGWVARIQIQGQIEIARIPLAAEIPTPEATATSDADETATPGEEPTLAPANDTITVEVISGNPGMCQEATVSADSRFTLMDINAKLKPFEYDNYNSIVSQEAVKIDQDEFIFPLLLDMRFEGDITPGGCDSSDNTCDRITFKICISAAYNTPPGGYSGDLDLVIGKQSYDKMYPYTTVPVFTQIVVISPTTTG